MGRNLCGIQFTNQNFKDAIFKQVVRKKNKETMPPSPTPKTFWGKAGRQEEGHVTHTGYEAEPALTRSVALEEFDCTVWLRLWVHYPW